MSQTQRSSTFKNRGQTVDENRARRKEQTVELRKEKRDVHLAKRRHMADGEDIGDVALSDGVVGESATEVCNYPAVLGHGKDRNTPGLV